MDFVRDAAHSAYTLVLAFYPHPVNGMQVLLVRKVRGATAGSLNGLGGAIEVGEQASAGVQREFREESGLDLPCTRFDFFGTFFGPWGSVWCYRVRLNQYEYSQAMLHESDEQVGTYSVGDLPKGLASHLEWLIPMALNEDVAHASVNVP